MRYIKDKQLIELTKAAQNSNRKRKNFNFHQFDEDLVQRMLNAFEPHTYVKPHTHSNPDKREVFIILTGRLLVIFFDENGNIIDHIILDRNTGVFGVEIAPGEWHSATGLEKGTVVYEIKDGPYVQVEDKNFATWAPDEGSEASEGVLKGWLEELDISIPD